MASGNVECRGLVRIFAVAHGLGALDGEIQTLGQFFERADADCICGRIGGEAFEFGGNFAVVARGASVSFAREIEARGEAEFTMLSDFGGNGGVIGVIGDNANTLEILRGGADHRGAANVDIFDELGSGDAWRGGGGGEGIKIHDDEIDGNDAVLYRLLLVFGFRALVQNSAVYFRVQRLHAAAEHFGPAGEIGNVANGDAGIAQKFGGAAGGNNFDAERTQLAREFDDAGLVVDADESASDACLACHCGIPPELQRVSLSV